MVAYVRTVKTSSGAIAVQIVWSSRRSSRSIEHVGSAHDEAELAALKAAARQRLADGQGEFDLGLDSTGIAGAPMEIVSSRAGHLWDALCRAYELLGLDHAAGGDGHEIVIVEHRRIAVEPVRHSHRKCPFWNWPIDA